MFHELSLIELKGLVKDLRAHHNIRGYSRMKKQSLVAELDARFVLRDGNLYLKEALAPRTFTPKAQPARSNKKDLERNIYHHLIGLSTDELSNLSLRVLREDFQELFGIDMIPHKAIFEKIAEEVKTSRR